MESNKFNKILLACNAVLLLGLIGIYIIHFTGVGTKSKVNADATAPLMKEGGLTIAYVNTDTLLAKYQYAIDMEQELLAYKEQQESLGPLQDLRRQVVRRKVPDRNAGIPFENVIAMRKDEFEPAVLHNGLGPELLSFYIPFNDEIVGTRILENDVARLIISGRRVDLHNAAAP